ncbi:MAG TPA: radical SAM protein [Sphingomicrobium sp.]|nr:radical SAM protein [Sphingomicrobium sp.]
MQNQAELDRPGTVPRRHSPADGGAPLSFIWLELTSRCNLECVHCYANSGPHEPLSEGMTRDDWRDALEDAAALRCKAVQFIGGEPTIHPDLPYLIEHARSIGFERVWVYTNGTRFTDALKKVFLANRVSLAFSVYGSEGPIHDEITLRRGSHSKTLDAIRWSVAAGLTVRAGIIQMKSNANDVQRTRRMLNELGVSAVHVDRLRKVGRGAEDFQREPELRELCGRCGKDKVCVTAAGEIYPCVFARSTSIGGVFSEGLAAAVAGPRLRGFKKQLALVRAGPDCSPEEDPGPCSPDTDPGPCSPEQDPGPCSPEQDPGPCNPDRDPGPCGPDLGVCFPDEPPPPDPPN